MTTKGTTLTDITAADLRAARDQLARVLATVNRVLATVDPSGSNADALGVDHVIDYLAAHADRVDAAQARDAEDQELARVISDAECACHDSECWGYRAGENREGFMRAARAVRDHLLPPGSVVLTAEQAKAVSDEIFDADFPQGRFMRERKAQRLAEWLIAEARHDAIPPGAQVITEGDELAPEQERDGYPNGTYATIRVEDGASREWPVVERVGGGWQSGAHHYPDHAVSSARVLTMVPEGGMALTADDVAAVKHVLIQWGGAKVWPGSLRARFAPAEVTGGVQ